MPTFTPIIGKEFSAKVIPLLDEAQLSIDIIVFDWRWYPNNRNYATRNFNDAILAAKSRGVKVRVLSNSMDLRRFLNSEGIVAKGLVSSQLLHAKLIIVDGRSVVIGSHNLTEPAFTSNIEASVMISDWDEAQSYVDFFNNLFANGDR